MEFILKKFNALFFVPLSLVLFFGCGSTKVEDVAPPPAVEEPKVEEPPVEIVEEPKVEEPPVEIVEEPKVEEPPLEIVEEPKIEEPEITKTVPEFSCMKYKVKRKDDYHKIARKFYKVRHLWPCIYDANVEKYPNPDLIRTGTYIRVPKILSISKEAENIKAGMFQAYNGYVKLISLKKTQKEKAKNRSRAVGVLVSAELLIPGFIKSNEGMFDKAHVAEAKRVLWKSYRYRL